MPGRPRAEIESELKKLQDELKSSGCGLDHQESVQVMRDGETVTLTGQAACDALRRVRAHGDEAGNEDSEGSTQKPDVTGRQA
jgi:hypothetical protein